MTATANRYGRFGTLALALLFTAAAVATPRDFRGPVREENDLQFRLPNGQIVGTGAKRPNAEQWAWGENHMARPGHVELNELGLARVKAALAARARLPLEKREVSIEALGQEVQAGSDTGAPRTALASAVDNSTLPAFPPIGDQGALGSCAQFAAVYYTLTHMTALARGWDAKTGGGQYHLSPKWTLTMLNGGENWGTWHYDAYAIAQKHGVARWSEFPYDGEYRGWCMNSTVWSNAVYVRADQTGKIQDLDSEAGLGQLKQLLVNGYVLNCATYINSWQWKPIGDDPATTADDFMTGKHCVSAVDGVSGGHVMTIVGYNDDIWVDLNEDGLVTPDEKGALRIANSWGASWGENGFCWIAYQALRARNPGITSEGIFWYDEATWVTARSDYQPRLLAQFTLNHSARDQLAMTLGTSALSSTVPTTLWNPNKVIYSSGGAFAFDGTSSAVDGTFYFDFTDLLPANAGTARFYLGMYDGVAGSTAILKDFRLLDLGKGIEVPCHQAPRTADRSQAYAYVDYDAETGTVPVVTQDSGTVKAPSHLSATVASNKVVRLSWVNNAWNATGFHVERASKTGIGAGIFTRITEQPATATEYSDPVGSGIFSYRVHAVNTATGSASSYSNRAGARVK